MVESHGGKRHTLIVRDYFSRYTWVYFMRHKSDAAKTFKQFLADTRADGVPSQAVIVRSYGPSLPLPFLKSGHCKVKRENKSQAKAHECFTWALRLTTPARVLTKHRTLLITRHVTWQSVSPAPPVPAQMHGSLCQAEGGSEADDESTSDRGVVGAVDERDDGLDRLNNLDVAWGFDLHAFLRERSQEIPAAGDAGDGAAETMDSSQGGAVDASPVPAGRAETGETMGSSQGGAVEASSVPAGRAESDSGASEASGTDQGKGDDPPSVLLGRAAHELISWGRLPSTVRGRTRSQRQYLNDDSTQRMLRIQHEVEDALYAAVQEWTEFGSMPESTSWTTEDALAMMAGGPAVEENKGS